MNLKRVLIELMTPDILKAVCTELDIEADRRSAVAMNEAVARSKRAKPELLVEMLSVTQLRQALAQFEQVTNGKREELVRRLLEAGGRALPESDSDVPDHKVAFEPPPGGWPAQDAPATRVMRTAPDTAEQYRHADQAVQRPDAGVQDQFLHKKPPRTYRYDSSLDPALSWDEQRERDLGEWLIGLIGRAAKEGEAAVFGEVQQWQGGGVRLSSLAEAAQMLQRISKPFLNWTGKAERHEIRVPTAPLFVHERHSTKAILDGIRHRKARGQTLDLFGDAGMDIRENLEAYEHKGPWQNRMILGDSLSVMNSLLEFEGMAGQVQMIYIDPPYGVKFGSNFQPFVRKRGVKHGGDDDMTREPEMVKAYRDTWELGLHSYLSYLRDRLVVARELLTDSGSVFVQISDENLHHVREVLDEVFSCENFAGLITIQKTSSQSKIGVQSVADYLIIYSKDNTRSKFHGLLRFKRPGEQGAKQYVSVISPDMSEMRKMTKEELAGIAAIPDGWRVCRLGPLTSQDYQENRSQPFRFLGKNYPCPKNRHWSYDPSPGGELERLAKLGRIRVSGDSLASVLLADDNPTTNLDNVWLDTGTGSFTEEQLYVVQTGAKVIQRCLLMCTDPGDLVLDPTCGSGTTAFVAEQWGRRWITIDTSRVPLALARQRLLTATFPYYDLRIC